MSKASEWSKEVSLVVGERGLVYRLEETPVAGIGTTPQGPMLHLFGATLDPEHALALARWILDTFE